MVRVVFAEDNYLVREGTSALLQATDEVELIGTASSFDELMTAVEELKPDVVLTDIRMPPSNTTEGIDAARRIRADHPDIGVVVLSQFAEEAYAYELLKDGAAGLGYLLKERVANLEELVRAINEVAKGGSVLDPKVVEALVSAKDRMAHSPLAQLTDREREVLENMAQGKNNASIAKSLFLTERAVEKHINSLFHKLGLSEETDVHRRVKAVLAFLRESDPPCLTPEPEPGLTGPRGCPRSSRSTARAGARGSGRCRAPATTIRGSRGCRARSSRRVPVRRSPPGARPGHPTPPSCGR